MNQPGPDIDPSIAHLDFAVCQCEMQDHPHGHCTDEATRRVELHALDHCTADSDELNEDGNRVLDLCPGCYEVIRKVCTGYVAALSAHGRPHCLGCGAPITCVRHVIREAKKL